MFSASNIFIHSGTFLPGGVGVNTASTAPSFAGVSSTTILVPSGWTQIVVDESPRGASDGPEIEESSQIEEIEGAEDIPANDDDSLIHGTYQFDNCHVYESPGGASDGPEIKESSQIKQIEGALAEVIPANDDDSPIHGTYHFDNCHVFINSFNARGVKVNNSGNYAPRFTHHGGTALNQGPSSSVPCVEIDVPFSTFEQKQPMRGILPATVDANLKMMQSNPAPTTLPASGPESQSNLTNPFLPIHMGLHPNVLSILQPFPDDAVNNNMANDRNDLPSSTNLHPHHNPATPNSLRHRRPDTDSKSLEHHLDSALAILIQTSGILADGDDDHGVTPQARNTLKAINALIPMETTTYPPPFKSVGKRKMAKWLQIPRSLK